MTPGWGSSSPVNKYINTSTEEMKLADGVEETLPTDQSGSVGAMPTLRSRFKPKGAVRLHVQPIPVSLANSYVSVVHRHHGASPEGFAMFSIAAVDDESVIRGVATAAVPNAANRLRDGFRTMEVVRVATDGTPNACSILYAACARAAKALGYSRVVTYVLDTETGTSVKAAGWSPDEGDFGNLSWANRPGRTGNNFGPKGRWSLNIAGTERPKLEFPEWVTEELAKLSLQESFFTREEFSSDA